MVLYKRRHSRLTGFSCRRRHPIRPSPSHADPVDTKDVSQIVDSQSLPPDSCCFFPPFFSPNCAPKKPRLAPRTAVFETLFSVNDSPDLNLFVFSQLNYPRVSIPTRSIPPRNSILPPPPPPAENASTHTTSPFSRGHHKGSTEI